MLLSHNIIEEPDYEEKLHNIIYHDCTDYFADDFDPYSETGDKSSCGNDYFESDDYITYGCNCSENHLPIDNDYLQEQISLKDINR